MTINFTNLYERIIPLDKFPLSNRFKTAQGEYTIPSQHLGQLKPLDAKASNFLWNYISDIQLHYNVPFKDGLFRIIDKAKIISGNEKEIKKWLYHRGLPFDKEVYLSWQPTEAMIVPWKLLIKYIDCFYWHDDLTIIDQSLNWALLFYHENELYWGTNEKFIPDNSFSDINFIW